MNQIPAMIAYWDAEEKCVFSNEAYREWFGKSPDEMVGMSLKELLGPLYELNLPFILGALKGEKQVFERQIRLPSGGVRESIAAYTPDVREGVVRGFSVLVTDVTMIRKRETALERAVRERDQALAEAQALRSLLSICSGCKKIRDNTDQWQPLEKYLLEHQQLSFSHGLCPSCISKYFKDQ